MMDTLSAKKRSKQMALVRAKNTKPELMVRQLTHGMGYRYRLHVKKLPGNPDLVFIKKKKAIFVHGCFWHRHPKCKNTRMPKSRLEFWKPKLMGNARRDKRNQRELEKQGWKYLIIWECQLRTPNDVTKTIRRFLGK